MPILVFLTVNDGIARGGSDGTAPSSGGGSPSGLLLMFVGGGIAAGSGNVVPVASAVSISNPDNITLTGHYTYTDADGDVEGVSTYKWYRTSVAHPAGAVIAGATGITHAVDAIGDGGGINDFAPNTVSFEVTPVAATGTSPGLPVRSTEISIGGD